MASRTFAVAPGQVRRRAEVDETLQAECVPVSVRSTTERIRMDLFDAALCDSDAPTRLDGESLSSAVLCLPGFSGEEETRSRSLVLVPARVNKISGVVLTPQDDIPAFGEEDELEDYLPSRVRIGNAQKTPLAIIAARRFDRVYAQKGVFTIQHREVHRLEELQDAAGEQPHLVKLKIPRDAVKRLTKEIALLGVNKLMIFPQLDNAAAHVMETLG